MTSATIAQRWEALKGGTEEAVPPASPFRPLSQAVDDFVHWAQTPNDRVTLGIPDLDYEMRGIAPGELCLIVGYSHSGKTLTLLEILRRNRSKRVIYFCPDEPATLTLVKLACIQHGLRARELERQIEEGEPEAIDVLRRTAERDYPHLAAWDQSTSLADMERYCGACTDEWGQAPDLVVFDYLELLNGGGETVPEKAMQLKAWGRRHNVPLLVLHQTSRSSGADGKRLTISSGAYGGEQQATHMVGVRRKKFEIEAQLADLRARPNPTESTIERITDLEYDLKIHQYTLTLNLLKNKRPDASLLPEIDYEIEVGTGRLTRLQAHELPTQMFGEQLEAF